MNTITPALPVLAPAPTRPTLPLSERDRWREYEHEKRLIDATATDCADYERRIAELTRRLAL